MSNGSYLYCKMFQLIACKIRVVKFIRSNKFARAENCFGGTVEGVTIISNFFVHSPFQLTQIQRRKLHFYVLEAPNSSKRVSMALTDRRYKSNKFSR